MARPAKPKVDSLGNKQLDAAHEKFEEFSSQVKEMTLDQMNRAPKEETDPQTKMTHKEWKEAPEIYLKPEKIHYPGPAPKGPNQGKVVDVFNEKFRKEYEFDKQYVRFIAEHRELIGEVIEIWTRPYPGMPAEFWKVPTNKPIWGPRYLAEQIKRKTYHRLVMEEKSTPDNLVAVEGGVSQYGRIVANTTIQRLNAVSAPKNQIAMTNRVSSF